MSADLAVFFRDATGPVTIVSPFVKETALRRAIGHIADDVSIEIFTRWLPTEVAIGVSDLSVFDWARDRGDASVHLLRELHAKAYIRGARALVGSANMTGRGLGWAIAPNVELLIQVPANGNEVQQLLTQLQQRSVPATDAAKHAIEEAASRIKAQLPPSQLGDEVNDVSGYQEDRRGQVWFPKTSEPRRLYDAYSPEGGFSMLKSTEEDAERDLAFLQVPDGYDRQTFIGHIRAVLMQSSIFSVIDAALQGGEGPREALVNQLNLDQSVVDESWNVLADWLMFFFRDRYRVEAPQEAFRIVKSRAVE